MCVLACTRVGLYADSPELICPSCAWCVPGCVLERAFCVGDLHWCTCGFGCVFVCGACRQIASGCGPQGYVPFTNSSGVVQVVELAPLSLPPSATISVGVREPWW